MITDFALHQGGETYNDILRLHRVTVSMWCIATGALKRTHVFDVRIDGDSTPTDPKGVVAMLGSAASTGLVVANDDDLTYAILRLDERSTGVALAYVGIIDTAITRTIIRASLWNAVRDDLLDLRRFVITVLNAVPSEAEPAIRDRLLLFTAEVISSFLPGQTRLDVHGQALTTTIYLSRETEDFDA